MPMIQVRGKHTKPHLSRESLHLYIKGNASSVEELLLYSCIRNVLGFCSAAICKTNRHGVTSGFVTVPMAYVASLKSGLNFAGQLDRVT